MDISGTNWIDTTTFTGYTGNGYLLWDGPNRYGQPGTGIIEASLIITTPGTYRFRWRSKVGIGTVSTEHNDSWLKFPDADAFFGEL